MRVRLSADELSSVRLHASLDGRLLQSQRRRPRIFDVGAHCGDVTRAYLEAIPEALIVAVEPNTAHRESLLAIGSEQVTPVHAAVGSRVGSHVLQVRANSANSSMLNVIPKFAEMSPQHYRQEGKGVQVPVTTLDVLAQEYGWPIDILKIDVEGWEMEVLAGGGKSSQSSML